MRILHVEDDLTSAGFVSRGLHEHGYRVDHSADGKDGLFMALDALYDAMIVDRMLPALDGLSLVRSARAAGCNTPVLFLSALGEVENRVEGLRSGADDYLVKPFAFAELLARVEALIRRRAEPRETTTLKVDDLELNLLTREVKRGDHPIDVKPREFRLLEYLMRHAGQVVTRIMLLEGVWDYHFDPQTNVIEVHISRLRQKIDKAFSTPLLHTMRGAGYRLAGRGGGVTGSPTS